MGVALFPARAAALEAAQGATDFGQYFTYFSFFLMVSALMLSVLFFKLSIEQRLRQIGTLRAAGYAMPVIRRILLGEALVLALIGGPLGVAGAILYGRIIVHGLGTWWVGAVGTTHLELHVRPLSLVTGALGGVIAAAVRSRLASRRGRLSPRALLTAQSLDVPRLRRPARTRRNRLLAALFGLPALACSPRLLMPSAQAGAFFGAGAALLVSALLWLPAGCAPGVRDRSPAATHWRSHGWDFAAPPSGRHDGALGCAHCSAAFIIVSVERSCGSGGD